MRRILQAALTLILGITITNSTSAQVCGTVASFVSGTDNLFSTTAEGFTGDFAWSNSGSGQLVSTDATAGQIKTVRTMTYQMPAIGVIMYWSYSLGGTMNVVSYNVSAVYNTGSGIATVPVCSGGALSTVGNKLLFMATTPTEILGKAFQLEMTFVSTTTSSNKVLTFDNFSTNAFASNIILPVRFAGLDAKRSGSNINLTWNVDVEQNVNRYEIERSADGIRFSTIGSVAASGQRTYNFTDAAPLASGFYRIRSVDVDGKTGYSTVIAVKGSETSVTVKAFMTNLSTLTVQHDASTRAGRITVSAADGRLISSKVPASGSMQTTIDMSTTKPGLYIVRYETADGQAQTVKLIKN